MEEIKRDEKRELFVYTPPVGMEVKVVINELHYISKFLCGHTIEAHINDVIIPINKKSDTKKIYQDYLDTITKHHQIKNIASSETAKNTDTGYTRAAD